MNASEIIILSILAGLIVLLAVVQLCIKCYIRGYSRGIKDGSETWKKAVGAVLAELHPTVSVPSVWTDGEIHAPDWFRAEIDESQFPAVWNTESGTRMTSSPQ